eukprot:jgi/Botrbrau1/6700/Bobra.0202s0037.1
MERGYLGDRNVLLQGIQNAANSANFSGTLVWQLVTIDLDDWSFDFNPQQPGFNAISSQIQYYFELERATRGPPPPGRPPPRPPLSALPPGYRPSPPQPPPPPAQENLYPPPSGSVAEPPQSSQKPCTNVAPDTQYTCEEQVAFHPGCKEDFLRPGFCDISCGRCPSVPPLANCTDRRPPGSPYSCAEQVLFHPGCKEDFLHAGFCDVSCGRCTPANSPPTTPGLCTNIPPYGSPFTCEQQVAFHPGCKEEFLQNGTCDLSCGRCHNDTSPSPELCTDIPPFGSPYSCVEQVAFHPGCQEVFLQKGTCDESCGRCGGGTVTPSPPEPCTDIAPPGSPYTCEQQVAFHPGCPDEFLQQGTCDKSCGRCGGPPYTEPCTDIPPQGSLYTCEEQAAFDPGCLESFLPKGTCDKSCGRCGASNYSSPSPQPCTDTPPQGSPYTCERQVEYHPGCQEDFLKEPFCNKSCGRCS